MIIHWFTAFLMVAWGMSLLKRFGVITQSKQVFSITLNSLSTIQDPTLNDACKEAALKTHSKQLFRMAFTMIPGIGGAIALPVLFILLVDYLGWISLEQILSLAYTPVFLLTSIPIALAVAPSRKKETHASAYSNTDRMLHRIAFHTGPAQIGLANIESRAFARQLNGCPAENPVFITALPRAGTTLLLNCLSDHPRLASHCYRDMPFVLIPCLWNRFSNHFFKEGVRNERAHGDGMTIDFDSSEALEEVVWMNYWKHQYLADRIQTWGGTSNHDFLSFFREHMRKIIYIRRDREAADVRYVSKNNLNAARIDFLHSHIPDATFIIPFRDPVQHAASLLRQHQNFLKLNRQDPFIAEYMTAIGHFDFGANLRPIDFDGWLDSRATIDYGDLSFWIEYWQACYTHLLDRAAECPAVLFVDYDRLCRQPDQDLALLGRALELENLDPLLHHARDIRSVRTHEVELPNADSGLIESAYSVHARLQSACLG